MSIYHYLYHPRTATFDGALWSALQQALAREGFGLCFDAESNDFKRADRWQRISESVWPDGGQMFLCDSPASPQARVMLSAGSEDDNEVRSMEWPEEVTALLDARPGSVVLQLLFVDDEPADFFLALRKNLALLLDAVIDSGEELSYPTGGQSWEYPD